MGCTIGTLAETWTRTKPKRTGEREGEGGMQKTKEEKEEGNKQLTMMCDEGKRSASSQTCIIDRLKLALHWVNTRIRQRIMSGPTLSGADKGTRFP